MSRWVLGILAFFMGLIAAVLGTRRDRPRRDITAELDAAEEADQRSVSQDLARIETERVTADELAERRHVERVENIETNADVDRILAEARASRGAK